MSVIISKEIRLESKHKTYKPHVEVFKSTMELVDTCKNRKITDSDFDDQRTKSLDEDWCGVKTYDEALELMNSGWAEKVKELSATVENCKQTTKDKRVGFTNDVHGFTPIVPLAIMGVPNAMLNVSMKRVKSKVVSIYYHMGVSCGVSSKQIFENGRRIVELVVKLENCGYRVNLNVLDGYADENSADIMVVNVKSANQLLDLKRICFPTIHTAFFRVIGFDWYSKVPNGKYRSGYGTPLYYSIGLDGVKELSKKLFGDEAVYIDAKEIMKDNGAERLLETIKGGEKCRNSK